MRERISKYRVLRPQAEKRELDTWKKIVNFTKDEWFPSRLPFGKFKGRLYQEAREDAELRSWLEWQGSASSPQQAACQSGAKAGCQGEPVGPRLD